MPDLEVPVLIVDGSLVGMSAATLFCHHGIRPLVVEHHRGSAIHPRAAMITQRSMEILRTVGIEQIVMQKSDEQFVQDGAVLAAQSFAGYTAKPVNFHGRNGEPDSTCRLPGLGGFRGCFAKKHNRSGEIQVLALGPNKAPEPSLQALLRSKSCIRERN
jgi:hypothetical protein